MNKKLLKSLLTIGIIPLSLGLKSCSSNATESSTCKCIPEMQEKHEVELTFSNYQTYFDVSTETFQYGQNKYYFTGCLSYAFYEEVVVTLKYSDSYNSSNIKYETKDFLLNAGGNGLVSTTGYLRVISNVKGKVIYWM